MLMLERAAKHVRSEFTVLSFKVWSDQVWKGAQRSNASVV